MEKSELQQIDDLKIELAKANKMLEESGEMNQAMLDRLAKAISGLIAISHGVPCPHRVAMNCIREII